MDAEAYNVNQMEMGLFTDDQVTHLVKHWQESKGLTVDGFCGPQTQETLLLDMFGEGNEPSNLGLMVLECAIKEIGHGEIGGNNSGPHIARYKGIPDDGDPDDDGAWCASFISYCCTRAADHMDITLPFKTSHGAKALYEYALEAGSEVTIPKAGDFVCWDRGKSGSWQGHIGIIESFTSGVIQTIEGNIGRFPSHVRRLAHDLDRDTRLIGFVRLPNV
jgi:hypothetical protein